jgi:hypothetical protein
VFAEILRYKPRPVILRSTDRVPHHYRDRLAFKKFLRSRLRDPKNKGKPQHESGKTIYPSHKTS